jgi:hypothetical protein
MLRARACRVETFALALIGLIALCAAPAHANGASTDFGLDSPEMSAVLLASSAIAFGTADLLFAVLGRPLPRAVALPQIAVGGLLIPLLALTNSDSWAITAGAIASLAWFTVHGIYNIAIYPEYQRQKQRERARGLYGWSIEAQRQGAMLRVYAML